MPRSNFVVCLRNAGYEASLDRGARYRRLPDEEAARHHQVRIVDESGEDYLYPESCFAKVDDVTIVRRQDGKPADEFGHDELRRHQPVRLPIRKG